VLKSLKGKIRWQVHPVSGDKVFKTVYISPKFKFLLISSSILYSLEQDSYTLLPSLLFEYYSFLLITFDPQETAKMKSFTTILFASFAAYASVAASPARKHKTASSSAAAVATAAASTSTTGGAITRGASTIVMFEVGGVPGNECLTFRNNGTVPLHYIMPCLGTCLINHR
jgi:hypothetical protein